MSFQVLMAFSILVSVGGAIAGLTNPDYLILAVGWGTTAVVLLPTVLPGYRPWSSWSFVVMNVSIGFGVHSVAMLTEYPDVETINRVFLLGHEPADLVGPALLGLGGIAVLTASYLSARPTARPSDRRPVDLELHPETSRRALIVLVVGTTVTLAAFVLYAQFTGGLDWSNFSSKRTKITRVDIENDASFRSFAYLSELSRVGMASLLVILSLWIRDGKGLRGWRSIAIGLLFLFTIAIPVYGNVRADVLILALYVLALSFYSGAHLKIRHLIIAALIGALLVQAMTASRLAVGSSFTEALTTAGAQELVEPLVITQNFADIGKTSHIHMNVPIELEWAGGDTYATWLVAFIPRDLWQGKPLVVPGPIIGNRVYGNETSGVPPGLIGEAFWNFGYFGVALVCFLMGRFVGFVDRRLLPARGGDPFWVVVVTVGLLNIGGASLSESLGQGVFVALLNLGVAVPIAWWVWSPTRRQTPTPVAVA